METFRHQRRPGSDRFLGLFTQPESTPSALNGVELHEDEIFWTGTESNQSMANPNPNSTLTTVLPESGFRHLPERNFGFLPALPERNPNRSPNLMPKVSVSSSSASTSPSSSSARMIPVLPKAKPAVTKIYYQSAPVNVPVGLMKGRKGWGEVGLEEENGDDEEEMMMPPHEIVARAAGKESPMTTFSVLEGVGRTLKGRDLRRVRNAVFQRTGFLD